MREPKRWIAASGPWSPQRPEPTAAAAALSSASRRLSCDGAGKLYERRTTAAVAALLSCGWATGQAGVQKACR